MSACFAVSLVSIIFASKSLIWLFRADTVARIGAVASLTIRFTSSSDRELGVSLASGGVLSSPCSSSDSAVFGVISPASPSVFPCHSHSCDSCDSVKEVSVWSSFGSSSALFDSINRDFKLFSIVNKHLGFAGTATTEISIKSSSVITLISFHSIVCHW